MLDTKAQLDTGALIVSSMIALPLPPGGIPNEVVVHLVDGYGVRVSVETTSGRVILVDQINNVLVITPFIGTMVNLVMASLLDYTL